MMGPLKEKLVTDESKFDALLAKLLNAKPLLYKELLKEAKLRKDGKRKRSSGSVRKADKL
jgi:hypothetical protein